VFDRFTSTAREVVVEAQEQARALGHGHIGSEHLLLGIVVTEPSAATAVLADLDLPAAQLGEQLLAMLDHSKQPPTGHMPFTSEAKRALEFAVREAVGLNAEYIGPEHLLLGIASGADGSGPRVLADRGVTCEAIRRQILALGPPSGSPTPPAGPLRGFLTDPARD
jgi:ATP-dependent Clp protease ATP-binding subunit ClpA